MNEDRIYSLIAIANKAGFVVYGEFKCLEKIREGKGELIVVAEDSGKNCKKKFTNKSEYYKLDYLEFGSKENLGKIIGKDAKSVIVISDEGLKNEILRMI